MTQTAEALASGPSYAQNPEADSRLDQLAQTCLSQTANINDAAAAMWASVQRDDDLYFALLDPLGYDACYRLVRNMRHKTREASAASPKAEVDKAKKPSRSNVVAYAQGSLLARRLPGRGPTLANATHEDLIKAADLEDNLARQSDDKTKQHYRNRDFYRLIDSNLPADKKVADVFNEDNLSQLNDQIQSATVHHRRS